MYNPISTYRIQFHKDFTFKDLDSVIPYLDSLGVSTIYASPIFEATPGSTHGYDVLNPNRINPEIGTLEELRELSKKLLERNIGWIQDIVPNHMAFDTRNPWVYDLLQKGPESAFSRFLDIDWESGPLMVPFLGASLNDVINNGELKPELKDVKIVLSYYDSSYPVRSESYQRLAQRTDESLQAIINRMIGDKEAIRLLAEEQHYRLCHWQETDQRINYRRFFTVNGLICTNIQNEEVFSRHHALLGELLKEGIFQGLRVDHIDGLFDPAAYLERLRKLAGPHIPIYVEKILEPGEELPSQWPIQGETGYAFLSLVNNLLTEPQSEGVLTNYYNSIAGTNDSIEQQVHDKKRDILYNHMNGELENLYQLFIKMVTPQDFAEMRTEDIKTALGGFLIYCPVYRFYGSSFPLSSDEVGALNAIFDQLRADRPDLLKAIELVRSRLMNHQPGKENGDALYFYQRCMQFTGPLMAKGVEDTLMYTYLRFLGHNEVGDSPATFSLDAAAFHSLMKKRREVWPLSLNATATHDTKRGEDSRARLNAITSFAPEWIELVQEWREMNRELRKDGMPDDNDEYFIYQTLVASYSFDETEGYKERLLAYLEKALREAKRHSNWTSPNEAYEYATGQFALALLQKDRPFWISFSSFLSRILTFANLNFLNQLILKFTCPGIPDIYQGCELMDLSFVDPDNRRPVDFNERENLLAKVMDYREREILSNYNDGGNAKLLLTHELLSLRKEEAELFTEGKYMPLEIKGIHSRNLFAFARCHKDKWIVVVLTLHLGSLCKEQAVNPEFIEWGDTRIVLPVGSPNNWHDSMAVAAFTGREISVTRLFEKKLFALLRSEEEVPRAAGILLHLSSLPSDFGIGDMGPQAFRFADFLNRSKQKFWQLLPLNPTGAAQGYSPYSSFSAMAGNPIFISPEILKEEGLITEEEMAAGRLHKGEVLELETVEKLKAELVERAYDSFRAGEFKDLSEEFMRFKADEAAWLDEYCLYMAIKKVQSGSPWYEWPLALRNHQDEAVLKMQNEQGEEIERQAWIQFIFDRQWKQLKNYVNRKGIHIIGDLPIYVSYDSVDVWANQKLFRLSEDGERLGMAGVPPDAFSADGQLWGMPVYDWEAMTSDKYKWWISRLKKNSELFDLIRLDHFRGFEAYWEVRAGESSARNGSWKPGPGTALFDAIKEALGGLPFIAEDLGEITAEVRNLRDAFHLPGMKVLQFAFDESLPDSEHIPHNYTRNFIVYTGTHDNNTSLGWFADETDEATKERIRHYAGFDMDAQGFVKWLCRQAYASVASIAILPMQDVLGLGSEARMNVPASVSNNWSWRLQSGQYDLAEGILKEWAVLYGRASK